MNKQQDVIKIILGFFVVIYFFYLGTTTNDPKVGFVKLLQDLVQALSSIATIIACFIALRTYQTWVNNVTKPDAYKIDLQLVKALDSVHEKCFSFSNFRGFRIESIIWEYQRAIEEEVDEESACRLSNQEELEEEWRETQNSYKELVDYRLLQNFDMNVIAKYNCGFRRPQDIPKVIHDYRKVLDSYVTAVRHTCNGKLCTAQSRVNSSRYTTSGDLSTGGEAFKKLEDARIKVHDHYRKKWQI